MSQAAYALRLLVGYVLGVAIETVILAVGLSSRHGLRRRLFAGVWLTSCTYPVVVWVLPFFIDAARSRSAYLFAAETFAPAAECLLFWAVFDRGQGYARAIVARDCGAILVANLASFGVGECLNRWGWG
jgi:hypothetical protein